MTAHHPRLAVYLLSKFALGHDSDAMIGDALERYAADGDGIMLWRQVLSIISAQTIDRARTHTGATLGVVLGGWFAYWASATPGTALFRLVRVDILKILAASDHYTQAWVFWSSLIAGNMIVAATCFAIGWILARLSRDAGFSGVALFALSTVVLEGGALIFLLGSSIASGRADLNGVTVAPLRGFFLRPLAVILGGLLGSRTAEPIALA